MSANVYAGQTITLRENWSDPASKAKSSNVTMYKGAPELKSEVSAFDLLCTKVEGAEAKLAERKKNIESASITSKFNNTMLSFESNYAKFLSNVTSTNATYEIRGNASLSVNAPSFIITFKLENLGAT